MRWFAAATVGALAVGLVPSVAGAAGTLYGSANGAATGFRNPQLVTINIGTGAATVIGQLPFAGNGSTGGVTEIVCQPGATSPANAVCYAQQSDGGFHIAQFNLSTGAIIGSAVADGDSFSGLAYVGSTLYGTTVVSQELRILNPTTGTSTLVGATGTTIAGLAWDGTTMYGIQGGSPALGALLYTVNLTTGAVTTVGNTGIKAGGLQFGPDGNLYAGGNHDDGGHIYRIDKATGAATLIGPSGIDDVTGLALLPFPFAASPPPPAPVAVVVTPRFTG